jgi:hypothetical protein
VTDTQAELPTPIKGYPGFLDVLNAGIAVMGYFADYHYKTECSVLKTAHVAKL